MISPAPMPVVISSTAALADPRAFNAFGKLVLSLGMLWLFLPTARAQDEFLPFSWSVETFQDEDDERIRAFILKLEQPFLAEEFEQSNYLRLKATDERAFLIYPRETRFEQKHAEFYGRLRGEGECAVELSYETVSENPDGSRRVIRKTARIPISIPQSATGSRAVYQAWADEQNGYFAGLLQFYPGQSFFEYLLLQSADRYGVKPPRLPNPDTDAVSDEEALYHLATSGLGVQQQLQRSSLKNPQRPEDLTQHISSVKPPELTSGAYDELLEQEPGEAGLSDAASMIPADQYYLQLGSWTAARNLRQHSEEWLVPLARMLREDALDHQLLAKYEQQLQLTVDQLEAFHAEGILQQVVLSGSDFFVAEGTDLTLLLQSKTPEALTTAVRANADRAASRDIPVEIREFTYRGAAITACYTQDRRISSFYAVHDDRVILSNSHVGIRRIIDTIQGRLPSVADQTDAQLLSSLLPAENAADEAWCLLPDAFLRYLYSPEFKIGERRRKQSLNHLVMINNASLFHRLEYGTSPESLSALSEGRFLNPEAIICPQGGAYAFDRETDTGTSSVFNRIRYLTPIRELKILKVSPAEASEYQRYTRRFASFWQKLFTPVALKINTRNGFSADYCLLPNDQSPIRQLLRSFATDQLGRTAAELPAPESAFLSFRMRTGREQTGRLLKSLPGVTEVLQDDPTLTDLNWLGDHVTLHLCDAHSVLQIDPSKIRAIRAPFPVAVSDQLMAAAGLFSAAAPTCLSVELEDEARTERFLTMLGSRIFLYQDRIGDLPIRIDSYQLPSYRERPVHALTFRVYAATVRLYIASAAGHLFAATEPGILHEAINAGLNAEDQPLNDDQLHVALNPRAIRKMKDDLEVYFHERARRASHRNIMPVYILKHLYDLDITEIDAVSQSKYGVRYFCPGGEYAYDADRDQVYSTAYGNRERAVQQTADEGAEPFERIMDRLGRVELSLRQDADAVRGRLSVGGNAEE